MKFLPESIRNFIQPSGDHKKKKNTDPSDRDSTTLRDLLGAPKDELERQVAVVQHRLQKLIDTYPLVETHRRYFDDPNLAVEFEKLQSSIQAKKKQSGWQDKFLRNDPIPMVLNTEMDGQTDAKSMFALGNLRNYADPTGELENMTDGELRALLHDRFIPARSKSYNHPLLRSSISLRVPLSANTTVLQIDTTMKADGGFSNREITGVYFKVWGQAIAELSRIYPAVKTEFEVTDYPFDIPHDVFTLMSLISSKIQSGEITIPLGNKGVRR